MTFPYPTFSIAAALPAVVTYRTFAAGTSGSVAIGTAATGRLVVLAVHYVRAAGAGSPAGTIGGVAATLNVVDGFPGAGSGGGAVAILSARVDTGTSAAFTLTMPSSSQVVHISAWTILNLISHTPVATASAQFASVTTQSVAINVLKNGALIAASTQYMQSPFGLTAGVTQDHVSFLTGSSFHYAAGGHLEVLADQTGRTVTVARTSGALAMSGAIVAVSYR